MTSRLRRFLYIVCLYLGAILKELEAMCIVPEPPVSPAPNPDAGPQNRFFFIVVEVAGEDEALIRRMHVNPSVAAAIQLPEGCQFRTCFEISAEYAKVVINM